MSRLFIAEADVGDSGNYTCDGGGGGGGGASSPNDTVKVHVLVDGEWDTARHGGCFICGSSWGPIQ